MSQAFFEGAKLHSARLPNEPSVNKLSSQAVWFFAALGRKYLMKDIEARHRVLSSVNFKRLRTTFLLVVKSSFFFFSPTPLQYAPNTNY